MGNNNSSKNIVQDSGGGGGVNILLPKEIVNIPRTKSSSSYNNLQEFKSDKIEDLNEERKVIDINIESEKKLK